MKFGKWFGRARTFRGMALGKVAQASGVGKRRLYAIESCDGPYPTDDEMDAIQSALGLERGSCTFDHAGLADEFLRLCVPDGEQVTLFCLPNEELPCYVGVSCADGSVGTTSGDGVVSIEMSAKSAVHLLMRAADIWDNIE